MSTRPHRKAAASELDRERGYATGVSARAARVAVEQGSTFGWGRYVGPTSAVIGIHTFGASAPLKDRKRRFGFTPEAVVVCAREQAPARTPRVSTLSGRELG
jgi:transketolase